MSFEEDESLINSAIANEQLVQIFFKSSDGADNQTTIKAVCDELLDIGENDYVWADIDDRTLLTVIFPMRLLKDSAAIDRLNSVRNVYFVTSLITNGIPNVEFSPNSLFYVPWG